MWRGHMAGLVVEQVPTWLKCKQLSSDLTNIYKSQTFGREKGGHTRTTLGIGLYINRRITGQFQDRPIILYVVYDFIVAELFALNILTELFSVKIKHCRNTLKK